MLRKERWRIYITPKEIMENTHQFETHYAYIQHRFQQEHGVTVLEFKDLLTGKAKNNHTGELAVWYEAQDGKNAVKGNPGKI